MQPQFITTICKQCGTLFEAPAKHYSLKPRQFCSQKCHYTFGRGDPIERFWSKVNKDGPVPEHKPELGQCWIYTEASDRKGYGWFNHPAYKHIYAHRMSWIIANGKIPDGLFVCHHCDTPPCCRPDHLFLGTNQDNHDDMVAKGRSTAGDKNPARLYPERITRGSDIAWAKLDEEKVKQIKELLRYGVRHQRIATRFCVSRECITQISRGTSWKHVI